MPDISRLNFAHLRYFWVVAREGTITAAAEVLNVTQPTISTQLAKLEHALGISLFIRYGNRLELTEAGRLVQGYAAEIFALADSMEEAIKDGAHEVGHRFAVGIVDSLPLLSAYHLLEPALGRPEDDLRVTLKIGKLDRLVAGLAAHSIDLVLSDTPAGPTTPVKVKDHLLVESDVALFGTPALAATLEGTFPKSLDGAPFLLHTENTPLRRGLDTWLARKGVRPHVAGEVEDVGLLQMLGRSGRGFFAAPAFVEDEICRLYGVEIVGRLDGVRERFYGLTLEERQPTPGIDTVLEQAGSTD